MIAPGLQLSQRLAPKFGRTSILYGAGTLLTLHSSLSIDSVFVDYTIVSQAENNTINLELPLLPLQRAFKSAINATSASLRLTKQDGVPILSLTVTTATASFGRSGNGFQNGEQGADPFGDEAFREESLDPGGRERETTVVHNIPIRVLSASSVESIHEPRVREPDVHVLLPSLIQLKAVSDRFTKLAAATASGTASSVLTNPVNIPKLELSANMHGSLKLSIATDALNISSLWTGLSNPELDPSQMQDGIDGVENHPSTKLKAAGPDAWATVRIDGRDWSRVLSVGRMGGRVIACMCSNQRNCALLMVI